MASEHPKMSKQ